MPKPTAIRESDVLLECKALLDFLKNKRLLEYWRVSVGGLLIKGKHLVPNKEMSGFSDIIILLPTPSTIFLELKAEKGIQTDNQKEFQRRVESMGHKYYLCKSRGELCEILEMNGIPVKLFTR